MAEPSPELRELAQAYGVGTEYWDWRGRRIPVSEETIVAVLTALGVDAATPQAVGSSLSVARRYRWTRMLPPCVVTRRGQPAPIWIHVTHGRPVQVWVDLETG